MLSLLVAACSFRSRPRPYAPAVPFGPRAAEPAAEAFGRPHPSLDDRGRARFRIGSFFFAEPWFPAGEGPADRDGLGPTFVATSCSACHVRDGKGSAPGLGAAVLVVPGTAAYGTRLQVRAVDGVPAEAGVELRWEEVDGRYPDGEPWRLRRPVAEPNATAFGPLPGPVEIRVAPALVGMGVLAAVPRDAVLDGADPDDVDGDGISGRVRILDDGRIGRFGWKAAKPTVAEQVADAFLEDLGITSPLRPRENCPQVQRACGAAPSGGSPELSADRLEAVAWYVSTSALPPPTGVAKRVGERLFSQVGCAACHRPSWRVSAPEPWGTLEVRAYTDLLLHDMGEGLAGSADEPGAARTEWRTAPLWGSGRMLQVNPLAGFLHDGRAGTVEEAVLWHGGEAEGAREAFIRLSAADRAALLRFIEAL